MRVDRKDLKREAKRIVITTKPNPILVALIYVIIVYILSQLYMAVSGFSDLYNEYYDYVLGNISESDISLPSVGFVGLILAAALYVVNMIIQNAGWLNYCLKLSREEKSGVGDIVEVFVRTGRILWLWILEMVFIFLWSLLFIIPGYIASYRYRQAFYILLDNPDMTARECLNESKKIMDGRKMELFILDLTLIGWNLLSSLLFLTGVWTEPYCGVVYAEYYNTIAGKRYYSSSNYTGGTWQN